MSPIPVCLFALALAAALAGCAGFPSTQVTDRTAGQAIDDATIGTRLKAALAADPELSALKINVDTTQGAVRLRGEVKSVQLRRKAEDLARRIDGVKSVDNQLMVTG